MSGLVNHLAGEAAEHSVARLYEQGGRRITARRWRGSRGEVDLIAREGDLLVFVEVKSAATHDQALQSLRPAQIRRIQATIEEYLAGQPLGQRTDIRFDLALVDRYGRIDLRQNILAA